MNVKIGACTRYLNFIPARLAQQVHVLAVLLSQALNDTTLATREKG
jgi:cobalamin biosynthesis protein CobD/CbiB